MNPLQIVSLAAAGLFTLIVIPGSCQVVAPGHRGVSVTLGSVNPDVKFEGLNFKKPWVEKIVQIPIQQRTEEGKTDCFSSDLQLVQVSYSLMYKLPELKVVELYRSYRGDPYETLVRPRLEEQMKLIVSGYKSEELVKSREIVKGMILGKLQKELAGLVDIQDVMIRNIDLSDLLEAAIESKQVEEQKSLAKVYQLKGAQQEAEITVVKAKAEAESIKIAGEALKENPGVVNLKIVEKWSGVSPTSIFLSGASADASILFPLK